MGTVYNYMYMASIVAMEQREWEGVGTVYMYMASNGAEGMGRSGGWALYTIICTWLAL